MMMYEKALDNEREISKMLIINKKYQEKNKSLIDQINLLIEISERLSKILELFETELF